MAYGNRCGCRTLSELDEERKRHAITLEESLRNSRKVQDLYEELDSLASTLTEVERKYSELSTRYRKSLSNLDDVSDTKDRLKNQSEEVLESNRKLKNNCDRLKAEVKMVRVQCEALREEAHDEKRKRTTAELNLTRDLSEVDKSCSAKLRRVASAHDITEHALRNDINELKSALETEKFNHSLTKKSLRRANAHISKLGSLYLCHNAFDCHYCYYHP